MKSRARAGIALVTGLVIACSATAGVSSAATKKTTKAKKVTIKLQVADTGIQKGLADTITDFQAANPSITVQLEVLPQDAANQIIQTQLANGKAGDLVSVTSGYGEALGAGALGRAGYLADLSKEAWTKRLPKVADGSVGADGKVQKLPIQYVGFVGIYDPELFAKAGLKVPTTYPELLSFCDAADKAGVAAFALGDQIPWAASGLANMLAGAAVFAKTPDWNQQRIAKKVSFAQSGWLDVFTRIDEMQKRKCFNEAPAGTSFQAATELFVTGKAAVFPFWNGYGAALSGMKKGAKLASFAIPGTDSADDTRIITTVGAGIAATSKSKHLAEAKKFLAFLATPAASAKFATTMDWPPLLPDVTFTPSLLTKPFLDLIAKGKNAELPATYWPSVEINNAMQTKLQGLLAGQNSPADVVAAMDKAWPA